MWHRDQLTPPSNLFNTNVTEIVLNCAPALWTLHISPLSLQEIVELPDYNKITFKENPAIPLEEIVPDTSPQAIDLLYKFLVYPSKQRCSATQVSPSSLARTHMHSIDSFIHSFIHRCSTFSLQALLHPYFFSSPLPAHHSELPIPQRGGRPPHQRLQAPPTDFSVDLPLQHSVVDPALLQGHCPRLWLTNRSVVWFKRERECGTKE